MENKDKILLSLVDLYLKKICEVDEDDEDYEPEHKEPLYDLKIGYETIKVFRGDLRGDYGCFVTSVDDKYIIISDKLDKKNPVFFHTLLHEVMHAYAAAYNIDDNILDEEGWVEHSSIYLTQFIADNLKVFLEVVKNAFGA